MKWMKWIKSYLKSRRQDDRIKIMTFIILLGGAMLVISICRIAKLNGQVGQSLEYILAENESMKIKDSDISEFKMMENVKVVSRQVESILTIYNEEEAVALDCVGLSGEYLSTMFGGEEKGGETELDTTINSSMKVFYFNQQAYEMLMQDTATDIEYSLGEDEKKYKGKIVLLKNGAEQEKPCVFFQMDNASLKKSSGGVRVCMAEDDLVGETKNKFIQKGYTISNLEAVNERNYHYEVELLHIKYGILIAGLCFVMAFSVYVKFMKVS